jgi:hypothetical protein
MLKGFVEISNRTKQIISAQCSEDNLCVHIQHGGSEPREATQEEVEEALDYYNKNGECKFHIFVDTPMWGYASRDCLICKKHIGLI